MKRTDPSRHLYQGKPYTPSWAMRWKPILVPHLGGHRGLVGQWRDHMSRNVKEADK